MSMQACKALGLRQDDLVATSDIIAAKNTASACSALWRVASVCVERCYKVFFNTSESRFITSRVGCACLLYSLVPCKADRPDLQVRDVCSVPDKASDVSLGLFTSTLMGIGKSSSKELSAGCA